MRNVCHSLDSNHHELVNEEDIARGKTNVIEPGSEAICNSNGKFSSKDRNREDLER